MLYLWISWPTIFEWIFVVLQMDSFLKSKKHGFCPPTESYTISVSVSCSIIVDNPKCTFYFQLINLNGKKCFNLIFIKKKKKTNVGDSSQDNGLGLKRVGPARQGNKADISLTCGWGFSRVSQSQHLGDQTCGVRTRVRWGANCLHVCQHSAVAFWPLRWWHFTWISGQQTSHFSGLFIYFVFFKRKNRLRIFLMLIFSPLFFIFHFPNHCHFNASIIVYIYYLSTYTFMVHTFV